MFNIILLVGFVFVVGMVLDVVIVVLENIVRMCKSVEIENKDLNL